MSSRRIYDREGHAHFVTFSCYHRRRLLDNPHMRDALLQVLAQKLVIFDGICSGYVVMPDHVHAIVWVPSPPGLSLFMKSWKQTSSMALKRMLRAHLPAYTGLTAPRDPFWQAKYYPFNIYSTEKAEEKLNYMHLNPVRAGLVPKATDWQWSSANHYESEQLGPVPLQWIF